MELQRGAHHFAALPCPFFPKELDPSESSSPQKGRDMLVSLISPFLGKHTDIS
jgi:hypothetical protein